MADGAMNRMFPALALLCAVPLAGCGTTKPEEPPLAGARIGGPFTLIDQNGRTVRDSDFAGRYRIVYFGYTYCPDVCPTDMAKIGQAMRILDKEAPRVAAKVVPIFITVDPERDTPAAIKQFVGELPPAISSASPAARRRSPRSPRAMPSISRSNRPGPAAAIWSITSPSPS